MQPPHPWWQDMRGTHALSYGPKTKNALSLQLLSHCCQYFTNLSLSDSTSIIALELAPLEPDIAQSFSVNCLKTKIQQQGEKKRLHFGPSLKLTHTVNGIYWPPVPLLDSSRK